MFGDFMMELQLLRQKHSSFIYDRYTFEVTDGNLVAHFYYLLEPGLQFVTKLELRNINQSRLASLNQDLIQAWLFNIGMVEGFSYWKAACSPHFVVRAGYLSQDQLKFWKDLLLKGMSEFFFINHINAWEEDFLHFEVEAGEKTYEVDERQHQTATLIPLSGGKDSLVTLELFKEMKRSFSLFTINSVDRLESMADVAGTQDWVHVTRTLDPQILELNQQGYLNGHTPFSAMVAFVSTLSAYVYGFSEVALSNEYSANEGNTTFLGQSINHQYSKTIDFEKKFREYCEKYLSKSIQYFSFLRPLHEIQIAQLFAHYPQYFSLFLSCNRGAAKGEWCGECPKCLFVAIMLAPFVGVEQLTQIYHQQILNKESLVPILNELTGMIECKSFECVGTRQETCAALALTLQKNDQKSLPFLLQYAKENIVTNVPESLKDAEKLLSSFQENNFLPQEYADFLRQKLKK